MTKEHYIGRWYDNRNEYRSINQEKFTLILEQLANGIDCSNELANVIVNLAKDNNTYILSDERLLRPCGLEIFIKSLKIAKTRTGQGELLVLISIRDQFDLIISRYLHNLYKLPHVLGSQNKNNTVHKLINRIGLGSMIGNFYKNPVYSLRESFNQKLDSCSWPYCSMKNRCSCLSSNIHTITPSFYDYFKLYQLLNNIFCEEDFIFIDIVSPKSKDVGSKRLWQFLTERGLNIDRKKFMDVFKIQVNSQESRLQSKMFIKRGIENINIPADDLRWLRKELNILYGNNNKKLAVKYPEISSYGKDFTKSYSP